jgi:hypothetical protein
MAQGSDDPVRSRVTDVAEQDRQPQGVLPDRVPQPPEDLAGRRAGRRVHGRTDQHQATDVVRVPYDQLHCDLAAEGVAQHRHGWQVGRFQPVGQVVGMLGDAQDPPRVAAEPEARQVDHVDRVMAGQLGRQRHQVAVGDRQPMEQDQRESAAGASEQRAWVATPRTVHQWLWNPQAVRGALVASRYRSPAAARARGTPGIAGCWPSSASWPGDRTRLLGEPKPPGW